MLFILSNKSSNLLRILIQIQGAVWGGKKPLKKTPIRSGTNQTEAKEKDLVTFHWILSGRLIRDPWDPYFMVFMNVYERIPTSLGRYYFIPKNIYPGTQAQGLVVFFFAVPTKQTEAKGDVLLLEGSRPGLQERRWIDPPRAAGLVGRASI